MDSIDYKEIGNRIRALRESCGYSQVEFADMLGITRVSLSNYERGIRFPDLSVFVKMAKLLNISIDKLVGFKPKRMSKAEKAIRDLEGCGIHVDDQSTDEETEYLICWGPREEDGKFQYEFFASEEQLLSAYNEMQSKDSIDTLKRGKYNLYTKIYSRLAYLEYWKYKCEQEGIVGPIAERKK